MMVFTFLLSKNSLLIMNIISEPFDHTQTINILYSVNTECNCYADGIMDDGICQRLQNASTPVGQCNCKINVEGRTCDRCKEGYFNLVSSNIEGCEGKL